MKQEINEKHYRSADRVLSQKHYEFIVIWMAQGY